MSKINHDCPYCNAQGSEDRDGMVVICPWCKGQGNFAALSFTNLSLYWEARRERQRIDEKMVNSASRRGR